MKGTTAVVILNWNGSSYLKQFLPAVVRHSTGAGIWIADNASTDDSLDYVNTHHPEVSVLKLDKNWGFAEGYNRALDKIQADNYVLLNSDVEVTEGWLQPLMETLGSSGEIVACQPKIMSFHDKQKFEYAGASGGYIDLLGYPFCRGRLFHHLEKDEGQYDGAVPVFWASGACLAIKSGAFKSVGGFDPSFFAHMEEIDLSWRLQKLNGRIMVNPKSTVYHVGGGTLNSKSPKKLFLNYRNGLIMLYKNTSMPLLLLVLPLRLVLDGVSAIHELLKGYPANVAIILHAHLAFYVRIPRIKRGRSGQKIKTIYPGSVVWKSFVEGKTKFSDLKWGL